MIPRFHRAVCGFFGMLQGGYFFSRSTARSPRRIGVLMNSTADDPEGKARNAAFERRLQELGWTNGRNVRIAYRWGEGDADRVRNLPAKAPR
jgi:hypothetical protein